MIKIGICDEDTTFIDSLYDTISSVMFSIDDWEAQIFHSSAEITQAIEDSTFDCQLVFIDIMIKNGLDTARFIFEHAHYANIIFITYSKDYVRESCHCQTFAYLLKPVSPNDISNELQRYIKTLNMSSKYLSIVTSGMNHSIPIDSIYYIESNRHKVIIHTTGEDYECYRKLNELEETLKEEGFLRCHQSFLVSMRHVTDSTLTHFKIREIEIPISRRYQRFFQEYFSQGTLVGLPKQSDDESEKPKQHGSIICIQGTYLGSVVHMYPEQRIIIGRDLNVADIQINLPLVSRMHCELIYHEDRGEYEITDFSTNGTFINQKQRLLQGVSYIVKSGTQVCFGDMETVYKLA